MSKLDFELPLILTAKGPITPNPSPSPEPGPGSGTGGIGPSSYQSWLTVYGHSTKNGQMLMDEYYQWWLSNGFTEAEWYAANGPDIPWPGLNP